MVTLSFRLHTVCQLNFVFSLSLCVYRFFKFLNSPIYFLGCCIPCECAACCCLSSFGFVHILSLFSLSLFVSLECAHLCCFFFLLFYFLFHSLWVGYPLLLLMSSCINCDRCSIHFHHCFSKIFLLYLSHDSDFSAFFSLSCVSFCSAFFVCVIFCMFTVQRRDKSEYEKKLVSKVGIK